jgi:hypothetical protein
MVFKTIVEIVPGYFCITERDFSRTRPDVWGFRSHSTHPKKTNGEKGDRKQKKSSNKQMGKKRNKMAFNKTKRENKRNNSDNTTKEEKENK